MNTSFTLYPNWEQRHPDMPLWHHDNTAEISVQEMNGRYYIYGRIHEDEFTRITSTTAKYRMRKLVRLFAHRILEHVSPASLNDIPDHTNAEEDLTGVAESSVDSIKQYLKDSGLTTDATEATLHFDGASRGNPGEAATGYVLDVGTDEVTGGTYLGEQTNNYAEYQALLEGIECALDLDVTNLSIEGDSELIVKQVTGEYSVNSNSLAELHDQVMATLYEFDSWDIGHVERDLNDTADKVANVTLNTAIQ